MTKYEELAAKGDMFVCYFTGGEDEATEKSWCPDCDEAKDLIKNNILSKTPHPVLKAAVMDRNTWVGVSDHAFKKHPVIAAKGIPTVILV